VRSTCGGCAGEEDAGCVGGGFAGACLVGGGGATFSSSRPPLTVSIKIPFFFCSVIGAHFFSCGGGVAGTCFCGGVGANFSKSRPSCTLVMSFGFSLIICSLLLSLWSYRLLRWRRHDFRNFPAACEVRHRDLSFPVIVIHKIVPHFFTWNCCRFTALHIRD
jgi:hypothetical protein